MASEIIKFTRCESEVMTWSAKGKTYEDISKTLCITEDTAKAHMESARNKLGAMNRIHAIAIAISRGYISM
jgi:LuxR family quorum sensing-dependent transcriptional regulator